MVSPPNPEASTRLFDDQAAGLRRLFAGRRGPATIAITGPAGARGEKGANGATRHSALVAGLARGLATAGKEVLIIDEHAGTHSVAAAFGLRSRYDLLQAVNRDVPVAKVMLQAETAIRLLPAARAARQHARLDAMERRALGEWMRRLQQRVDFVLVSAAEGGGADFSPLLPQPQRVVITMFPDSRSITEAYALMKRLAHQRDGRRFGIVFLRAAAAEADLQVFANLREVASRHLGVDLELIGGLAEQDEPGRIWPHLVEPLLDPPGWTAAMQAVRPWPEATPARAGAFLRGAPTGYPVV